jgi:hypothetical protein
LPKNNYGTYFLSLRNAYFDHTAHDKKLRDVIYELGVDKEYSRAFQEQLEALPGYNLIFEWFIKALYSVNEPALHISVGNDFVIKAIASQEDRFTSEPKSCNILEFFLIQSLV